jgi:hypothetical protein
MPSILDVILMIRKLLYMLEIITILDANTVGTNGPKAGVQVWQKKIDLMGTGLNAHLKGAVCNSSLASACCCSCGSD